MNKQVEHSPNPQHSNSTQHSEYSQNRRVRESRNEQKRTLRQFPKRSKERINNLGIDRAVVHKELVFSTIKQRIDMNSIEKHTNPCTVWIHELARSHIFQNTCS